MVRRVSLSNGFENWSVLYLHLSPFMPIRFVDGAAEAGEKKVVVFGLKQRLW